MGNLDGVGLNPNEKLPADLGDLSAFELVAAGSGEAAIPPTPPNSGWLLSIIDAELQVPEPQQGKEGNRCVRFRAVIEANSMWNRHTGEFRLFLDGKWPETSRRKFSSFAAATGLEGKITDTKQFNKRRVIVAFELSKDNKYVNPTNWWPYSEHHKNFIASFPAAGWTEKPAPIPESDRERLVGGDNIPF